VNSNGHVSGILPTDPFDQTLGRLLGLPNGAHTDPSVVQAVDFYGNATAYIVQTVKHDGGESAFVTIVASGGTLRVMLPPEVLRTIERQREATRTKVRRRHGKRLADERKAAGLAPAFMKNPGAGRRTAKTTRRAR
jgi:hypothetical protein